MDRGKKSRSSEKPASPEKDTFSVSAPAISLPKGGGAIRGIGEKFAANSVTGTGSMSVPIYTSPGRAGFGPKLALSYDSGGGNGPFGFGWSLSIPAIARKTDKGLPRYRDDEDSDVFLLAGAEDLVPVLGPDGKFVEFPRDGYLVRHYRPRIEGLFARIERWTRPGDTHWRSISRDNVTTVYGKTDESRIFDPADPARIFSWLICESYDDKGNAIVYSYVREDSEGVDLSGPHERNRSVASRSAGRYLKRIKYGNRVSHLAPPDPSPPIWLFEVVFDYDEGHWHTLPVPAGQRDLVRASMSPPAGRTWPARPDAFSSYRGGFEVRTYRRCRRVLMFHRFAELGPDPCLVRSTELEYGDLDYAVPQEVQTELAHKGSTRFASFLLTVTQRGHVRHGIEADTYLAKSLPPLEFEYSQAAIQDDIRDVDAESLENLPAGFDGRQYQWVDLDGEGLSGVLTEQAGAWFYKRNVSAVGASTTTIGAAAVRFDPIERLDTLPVPANLAGGQQLLDLAGDGQLDVVQFHGPLPGYFERTRDFGWAPFTPFVALPNISFDDPNLRFVDLTGDGHADLLISDDGVLTWHPSLGEQGFGPAERVRQALDEENGPHVVFADATQSVSLADMSGDGLSDVVRIRNGEVCYWPNLGYGRFGAKVTMDHSPWFDAPDLFDHRRIRLADIDGSGTTDILYLESDGVSLYFNRSGNSFSAPRRLRFPRIHNLSSVTVSDLLGNGTACLVWSSPLAGDASRPARYIDLMGGQKPHLLLSVKNNLGARTRIEYAPSTKFYLADKHAGTPWITRLPFPVHCVERVTVIDSWRETEFSTRYSYHHGYFDGVEREFRGFGRVEHVDVEKVGVVGDQPPVKTVTWYHTGAFLDRERILSHYQDEYVPAWFEALRPLENTLPEPDVDPAATLDPGEWREALRACKGTVLRQEVYELGVVATDARPVRLFSTAYHNCHIQRLQPRGRNRHAVFLATESEAITYHYELGLRPAALGADDQGPDPRIAHTLNLATDEYGNVLQSVAVVYRRIGDHVDLDGSLPVGAKALIDQVQGLDQSALHVMYSENRFTNDIDDVVNDPDNHRLPLPSEVITYEVTGVDPNGAYFSIDELRTLGLEDPQAVPPLDYHKLPTGPGPEKRLIEHLRTLYFDETLTEPLGLSELSPLGLPFETYKLALTEGLLSDVYGDKLTQDVRDEVAKPERSGYLSGAALVRRFGAASAGQYWMRSGVAGFAPNADEHFFLPSEYVDAFGNKTKLTYGGHDLFVASSTDAQLSRVSVEGFDFRVLAPTRIKDINDNLSEVVFDALGMPTAMALEGKGSEADDLVGFDAALVHPLLDGVIDFFTGSYDADEARRLLKNATARHLYYFGEQRKADGSLSWGHHPACAAGILRERHVADPLTDPVTGAVKDSPLQTAFEYSDGGGAVLVTKSEAEPAPATMARRWLASGKTVLNNKGKPVKQYEPYFSPSEHRFEEPVEAGVTPIMYYDAAGRLVRTELPDGTFNRVEFSPWHVLSFDANDTVLASRWYTHRHPPDATKPLPVDPLTDQPTVTPDQRAAWLAAQHSGTPALAVLDSLGRNVISITHNRYMDIAGALRNENYLTFTKLDAEGKPLWIRDARGNIVMQYVRQAPTAPPHPLSNTKEPTTYTPAYDVAGNLLFQHSMDAGDRWTLNDAAGKPMFAWDFNQRQAAGAAVIGEDRLYSTRYDKLHRPIALWLAADGGAPELVEAFRYGEGVADDRALNLRGRLHEHHDQSGLTSVVSRDFTGTPREIHRKLASEYKAPRIDWQANSATGKLEAETFLQITRYDALGRTRRLDDWHRAGGKVAVYEPRYNARGLLESETLTLGATTTMVIETIAYDAKGQREAIHYGNGTHTHFRYDPQTFRLVQLRTTRPGYDPTFPSAISDFKNVDVVQNLYYTYDPVGNVTEVYDDAYEPAFFDNQQVEPQSRYAYDALYRLIAASGREKFDANDAPGPIEDVPLQMTFPVGPNPQALRTYTQRYEYDAAGNIGEMRHRAGTDRWRRNYEYAPDSNRLAYTWLGTDTRLNTAGAIKYQHDDHGNMRNFDQVGTDYWLRWDHRDMIQALNRGGGGWVYYQYDAGRQRTRKVSDNGGKDWERIYLGGTEIYRRYAGGGVVEEIESHHVFDGQHRVLLVEDVLKTNRPGAVTGSLYRYQYGNHLGSACLELDAQAAVITYEEYHPYGTSAYRAARRDTEAPKRYRFAGKEKDEESGLSYYGARYGAPWLGLWTATDPTPQGFSQSLYVFCNNSPTCHIDEFGMAAIKIGVPDSHFIYTWDHGISQDTILRSQNTQAPLSMKLLVSANNLYLYTGSDNSSKQHRADVMPSAHPPPISLAQAKLAGPAAHLAAAQKMVSGPLGGTEEANYLWQKASANETNTYKTSQANYSKRLLSDKSTQADLVRETLKLANIEVDQKTGRMRLDPVKATGVSQATLNTASSQRANPTSSVLQSYVATAKSTVSSAAAGVKTQSKQAAKSFIPGAEFYDYVKHAVGGGSLFAGMKAVSIGAKMFAKSAAALLSKAAATLTATVEAGAVGTAAVTAAAVVAAAGAVTWAVEDTRRALRGEKTMTDVAAESYGRWGFMGTMGELKVALFD